MTGKGKKLAIRETPLSEIRFNRDSERTFRADRDLEQPYLQRCGGGFRVIRKPLEGGR